MRFLDQLEPLHRELVHGEVWTRTTAAGDRETLYVEELRNGSWRASTGDEDAEHVLAEGQEGEVRHALRTAGYTPPPRRGVTLPGRLSEHEEQRAVDTLVERLDTERRRLGATQGDIHRATGVPRSTVSDVLEGRRRPVLATLIQFAHSLGFEVTVRRRRPTRKAGPAASALLRASRVDLRRLADNAPGVDHEVAAALAALAALEPEDRCHLAHLVDGLDETR